MIDKAPAPLTFISNNVEGGISSFIKYLSRNYDAGAAINVIATTDITKNKDIRIDPKEFSANVSFKAFKYHPLDKRQYTLSKLFKLIDKDAVIVANDWLELEMASYFKITNKVVFILHGDYAYYYNLALKHEKIIDTFITINKGMSVKLKKLLPERFSEIHYQYPPIPGFIVKENYNTSDPLNIIYAGWINKSKGVFNFPIIDRKLKEKDIKVIWNIYGIGDLKVLKASWNDSGNVRFNGRIPNNELRKEYLKNDIVLLPSHAESLGLVIVEGMKAGLVPMITKLETGACEFITNKGNGFLFDKDDTDEIVSDICEIYADRNKLKEIGTKALITATSLFDETDNCDKFFRLFNATQKDSIRLRAVSFKFENKLDDSILPNFFIKLIRNIRKHVG